MHDEILNNGFVWYAGHHAIHSFTAQFVEAVIGLYLSEANLYFRYYLLSFANVGWHKRHMNWLRVRLLLDK